VDSDQNCDRYLSYCRTNDWVAKNCVKSCTNCDAKAPTTKAPTTTPATPSNIPQLVIEGACKDENDTCRSWVRTQPSLCIANEYMQRSCRQSCGACGDYPKQFNLRFLPIDLNPIGFLVGRWRSDFGGKAIFPSMPNSSYGEQIEFMITEPPQFGARFLNYTSFAWNSNNKEALHSEYGFVTVKNKTNEVALTTVMDNGLTTVEEGHVEGKQIRLKLHDLGRVSFVRDMAVHDLVRIWSLLDDDSLEAILQMETTNHKMQEHTRIVFKKVFP